MTRRRVGLHGVGPQSARLLQQLFENPDLEWVRLYDEDHDRATEALAGVDVALLERCRPLICSRWDEFAADPPLDVVIDEGHLPALRERLSGSGAEGPQILSPQTARLLWSHGPQPGDRKTELLDVLGEIVRSVDLTVDGKELFARMLEIAVAVTGASGGSLMLLGPERDELFIQVAFGVEPELWSKIRVPLGDGIAGQVAAEARPMIVAGRADAERYRIVRERVDVASALCVPLVHDGRVLGVLNLHHHTRADVFDEHDLAFMEELAALDAAIIQRVQAHAELRAQAARYAATREVHALLAGPDPLPERLAAICRVVARRLGDGIATLYLPDDASDDGPFALAASSLPGGHAGARTAVERGHGLDGEAARTGEAILLRNEDGRLRYAALPLPHEGRTEGVLAVQVGHLTGDPDELEANLLEVAAVIADGVARTRREARATAHALRVSAAHEAGTRLLDHTERETIAHAASASLSMLLGAEHVVVRLEDPASRRFRIDAYVGSADEDAQYALFALDKAATIETIRRRTMQLVRDLPGHPKLGAWAGPVASMMSSPLKISGRIVGTIAIYEKLAAESFFSGRFNEDDLQVFSHFIGNLERALGQVWQPTDAADDALIRWRERIAQELARASSRPGALALAICSIDDPQPLRDAGPEHIDEAMRRIESALELELRSFDAMVRLDDHRFGLLLPEPHPDAGAHVRRLAHAASERVMQQDTPADAARIVLAFGFTENGPNEMDGVALEERASERRIVMV